MGSNPGLSVYKVDVFTATCLTDMIVIQKASFYVYFYQLIHNYTYATSIYYRTSYSLNVSTTYSLFKRFYVKLKGWQIKKFFEVPPGLEPRTFCVLSRRDNHYTTEPVV